MTCTETVNVFSTIVNGVIPNQHGSPTPIAQEEGNHVKYKYSTITVLIKAEKIVYMFIHSTFY